VNRFVINFIPTRLFELIKIYLQLQGRYILNNHTNLYQCQAIISCYAAYTIDAIAALVLFLCISDWLHVFTRFRPITLSNACIYWSHAVYKSIQIKYNKMKYDTGAIRYLILNCFWLLYINQFYTTSDWSNSKIWLNDMKL